MLYPIKYYMWEWSSVVLVSEFDNSLVLVN